MEIGIFFIFNSMKNILYILSCLAIFSCKDAADSTSAIVESENKNEDITQFADYENDLEMGFTETNISLDEQIKELRDIIREKPYNIVDLAKLSSALNEKFDRSGNVENLNESVSFRESVLKYTAVKPEGAKRSLAQYYIKQHKFKRADSLIRTLEGDYVSNETKYVMFDIAMELGEYEKAEKLLNDVRNDRDYNYLIRAAKWNDYKGELSNTIINMEKALKLANESGNKAWKLWSNSNIADYYGHDGQIAKSYQHFLNTLELDPGNSYALKGIAWIAYSHDRQPKEALKIMQTLSEKNAVPDYDLITSEIAMDMGDEKYSKDLYVEFLTKTGKVGYGNMYNAYLIEQLATGTASQKAMALEIARKEIENRATPETYDLLGYALLMNDKESEALENHLQHVINKTFEPVAQMHTAQIYKANNMDKEADELVAELKEASYELGPVTMKELNKI
jgi:hypothetical protein